MLLKYADNSYEDEIFYSKENNVVKRVIDYITDPSKNYVAYTGCVGFPVYDIDMFDGYFYSTQILYGRCEGDKLFHLVIAFPQYSSLGDKDIMAAAWAVAKHIGKGFQVVFSVHFDTQCRHIHFVINSVSYVNGGVYKPNTTKMKQYYEVIRHVLPGRPLGMLNYELPDRYR